MMQKVRFKNELEGENFTEIVTRHTQHPLTSKKQTHAISICKRSVGDTGGALEPIMKNRAQLKIKLDIIIK